MRKFDNPEGEDKNRKTSQNSTDQTWGDDIYMWQPNMRVPFRFANHTMSWSMVLHTNHAQNYHHTSNKEGVRNNSEMVARAWTHEFLQMNITQMDNK